jgi:Galactose-3-O-sulfotransferase
MPQPDSFVIFLHIQKTGGITLQRILRRKLGASLGKRAMGLVIKPEPAPNLQVELQRRQMSDRYFGGHIGFGVHRFLPQPFTYITMLREPVSRLISLYHYSCTNPTAYYHKHAVGKSLEAFLLETPLMELDNGQVRFLAGDPDDLFINRTPYGACSEALLLQAQQNIEQHFSWVGIMEQFDPSLLLLGQTMGWKNCFYLRRNVARPSEKNPPVSPEVRSQIAQRNWLDLKLYQYAQQRLSQQLQAHYLQDQNQQNLPSVQQFRSQNQRFNQYLSTPYEFYDTLKMRLRGQPDRP